MADQKMNGAEVPTPKEEPKELTVEKIHVNAQGGFDRVELSDGSTLSGIAGGGFKKNSVQDPKGVIMDSLQLLLVGDFELVQPEKQQVQRLPRILGLNGKPLA